MAEDRADATARRFSPEGYAALLTAFRARGYAARGYHDARPEARHLVLRHDLDMSIAAALPIAAAESAAGLRATYFVLLRTEMYNPFSVEARHMLDDIRGLGHEIGLHLDAALYADDAAALDRAAAAECDILERILDAPVRVISFHRPAPALLGYPETLAGRAHAYQPRFFSEMGYCSDSRGAWHHGHPLDHEAVAAGRALQVLTHPLWWVAPADRAPRERLRDFLSARTDHLNRELAAHCDVHRPRRDPERRS